MAGGHHNSQCHQAPWNHRWLRYMWQLIELGYLWISFVCAVKNHYNCLFYEGTFMIHIINRNRSANRWLIFTTIYQKVMFMELARSSVWLIDPRNSSLEYFDQPIVIFFSNRRNQWSFLRHFNSWELQCSNIFLLCEKCINWCLSATLLLLETQQLLQNLSCLQVTHILV